MFRVTDTGHLHRNAMVQRVWQREETNPAKPKETLSNSLKNPSSRHEARPLWKKDTMAFYQTKWVKKFGHGKLIHKHIEKMDLYSYLYNPPWRSENFGNSWTPSKKINGQRYISKSLKQPWAWNICVSKSHPMVMLRFNKLNAMHRFCFCMKNAKSLYF